jgi:hypothetical protein
VDLQQYLELMEFHERWTQYDLLPPSLLHQLISTYAPGMEAASEHDRNSVFHWWLSRSPEKDMLMKLVELSFLDGDQLMAGDVRRHIRASPACDEEIAALLEVGGGPPSTSHEKEGSAL